MILMAANYQMHTVRAGDNLYKLGKAYGVSVDKLMEINGLQSNKLSIGQVLKIKELPQPKPASEPVPKPAQTPAATSVQKPVASPATSPPQNPNPDTGQTAIRTPEEIPENYYYIIQPKDNLYRISLSNKVPLKDILKWNNFPDENVLIRPGDRILIKDPSILETQIQEEKPAEVPAARISQPAVPDTILIEKVYVVQKKDTLFRIATENGMTVDELKKLNNLSSNDIQIGQKLYLTPRRNSPTSQSAINKANLTDDDLLSRDRIRADLIMPVEGRVVSEYGIRGGKPHKGIDIAAKPGTPIYAVLDGTVVYSGRQGAYGNVVVIEHPDFVMTVYAHNETNLVSVDDVVKKGQQIATIGSTGDATGPHIHFEYRYKGKAINPRKVLPLD